MQKEYFAAINSSRGFISFFDSIFAGRDRLYIIKGGPGTGKSTLMRKVADEAEKNGMDSELIFCSSDPSSLDGVIIPSLDTAIVDGTAPHLMDASLPGTKDEILNLGQFWNSDELYARRDDIELLGKRKSKAYKRVFTYLSAMGEIESDRFNIISERIDTDKLCAYAQRITDSISRSEKKHGRPDISPEINTSPEIRATGAVSMDGYTYLPTFERISGTQYRITDRLGIGHMLLDEISSLLIKRGIFFTAALDAPFERKCGIMIPGADCCITFANKMSGYETVSDGGTTVHSVNMNRFLYSGSVSELKSELHRIEKYKVLLNAEVSSAFESVRKNHFEIEKIYKSAMNFTGVDKATKQIIRKIFS